MVFGRIATVRYEFLRIEVDPITQNSEFLEK